MFAKVFALIFVTVAAMGCAKGETSGASDTTSSTSSTGGSGGSGGGGSTSDASTSSSSTSTSGGTGGANTLCTPGTKQCSGLDVEVCSTDGMIWETSSTCPFACSNGACEGVCTPGSNQCSGNNVETCDASGQWSATSACPFVCSGGSCTGSCVPGTKQCTLSNGVQTCDNQGQWVLQEQCPMLCSGGACTGSCTPGTTQCAGTSVQTCDSQGQWVVSQTCDYVCSNATCTGVCTPGATDCQGSTPRTCDSSGQWTNGSACPFVCSAGSCTGVCTPGATQCSGNGTQTCNAQGQWGVASSCPSQPNSSPTCSGNAVCGFQCNSGFANCDNGAGCETQLGTVQNCLGCGNTCAAPANATATCTAQGCGFQCLPGWSDCDGNPTNGCELNTTNDDWNCGGCGVGCYGGTCSNSTCGCVGLACEVGIEKVTLASNVTSMTAKGPLLAWTAGNSVLETAKTGGTPTVLTSSEASPKAITADTTKLYWANTLSGSEAIRSITNSGTGLTTLTSGHGPVELTHDGSNLYWSNQKALNACFCSTVGQTLVYKMPMSGGAPVLLDTMATPQAWQSWPGIAVTPTTAFWLRWMGTTATSDIIAQDVTNPAIFWTPGGGAIFNGQAQNSVEAKYLTITPNGTLVYYSRLNIDPAGIIALPSDGSGPSKAVTTLVGMTVKDLVADDTYAYIIASYTGESWDRIIRYPLSGPMTPPDFIANFQYQAGNLEIDGTRIYWTINGIKKSNVAPVEGSPTIVRFTK